MESPEIWFEPLTRLIDDLKSEMAYALCDEPHSAQALKFHPLFLGTFYTRIFHSLDVDTRVELNMFFKFVELLW
jgi:hypothetical protein